ncbi:hypothetical protein IF2G_02248 [Cordyceps javanica]|nr:hypothetical protein IF2G_02248 [Cordyceps javanica]
MSTCLKTHTHIHTHKIGSKEFNATRGCTTYFIACSLTPVSMQNRPDDSKRDILDPYNQLSNATVRAKHGVLMKAR